MREGSGLVSPRTRPNLEWTAHRNARRSRHRFLLGLPSALDRLRHCRWPPRWTLFPEPAVPEDYLDDLDLPSLDERDDLHRCATGRTAQGIRFVNLADQSRSPFAGFPSRGRAGLGGGRRLPFRPSAPDLIRCSPEFGTCWVTSARKLSGSNNWKFAPRSGLQFSVVWFGKSAEAIDCCSVWNTTRRGDPYRRGFPRG
jgi:hypothetical protein